jgi:hypothetical protein
VSTALGCDLRGKTIAVLGLTFKPNTDDMREAPSIPLIIALQDMGARVRAFDPTGMEQAKPLLANVTFCDDAYSCAIGASALVIVTEWEQFRALDFKRLKAIMARPVLVDLRNIYRAEEIARYGFVYEGIGRNAQTKHNDYNSDQAKGNHPRRLAASHKIAKSFAPAARSRPYGQTNQIVAPDSQKALSGKPKLTAATRRNAPGEQPQKVNRVRAAIPDATAPQLRPSLLRSRIQKITKPSKPR